MSESPKYLRFTISDRVEHWVQMASFTILAITGLVQKYATSPVSETTIRMLGGIETTRIIHRLAAIVLMLAVVYHLGALGYRLFVRRVQPSIIPTVRDIQAAWQMLLYNLGRQKNKPQQGRYTFDEKVEYWALVWGTTVMAITGFMMWNPIASARYLPGDFIPAAKAAHSGEALLAVLAILVWHFYMVHIKHFNKSMFTGYLSEEEMLEEHPLELADIKAGVAERPLDPVQVQKRRRIFFPAYGVIAAVLLFGIYTFVSFEETAITTVPPAEQVVAFSPLTPTPLPTPFPTSTPPPAAGITWDSGISAIMQDKCSQCHAGAVALANLDLSSYSAHIEGGNSGPSIVIGEPNESLLITLQSAGGHPGQFTGEELALIREWIESGAPEK
jgi:formate dehydrogenase gamma subunit